LNRGGGRPVSLIEALSSERPQDDPSAAGILASGDWLGAAYAAHGGELYGFAMRALGDEGLAEDAVQEAFVRAWRSRSRFDPALGSPRTWLFAITRNVIADLGRARARLPLPTSEPEPPATEKSLDELLLGWQMEEALRRIGKIHRQVLVETQLRGRGSAELAAELGIPVGTVKSRVYYGLRALRNVLEEMGYGD
jgi:RNA polymerase sigma-70 factor, ECF subfamily